MTAKEDWNEKYYRPVVEDRIVGYSGLDPQRKFSQDERQEVIDTVNEVIEEKTADIVEERINMIVDIQVGD